MKNIVLFTNTPITRDNSRDLIVKAFPNKKIIWEDNESIMLDRPYKNINVIYTYDRMLDGELLIPKEELKKVPLTNPYCTTIEFHKIQLVKILVSSLKTQFPELYIYYDEENWFGSPEELENM